MKRTILRATGALGLLGLAFASAQCSVIANADLGKGIGRTCSSDSECQGNICDKGVCASACTTDGDCPKPSLCLINKCRIGCRNHDDCTLSGTVCAGDSCRAGCKADTECSATQICDLGALTCKIGCRTDAACDTGKICEGDLCVAGCRPGAGSAKPCESGSFCEAQMPATVGVCKPAIQVGAIVAGKTDGSDAWSTSHRLALEEAVTARPFVSFKTKRYELVENVKKLADAKAKLAELSAAGANAVAVTSPTGYEAVYSEASKNPKVKFLAMGARDNRSLPNVSSYRTNTDAGWYIMGRIAGRIVAPTTAKCVGLILPQAGRQTVREANAFIMGARKQAPDAKVVVRWLGAGTDPEANQYTFTSASGFWSTTGTVKLNREELLTAQLADLGCSVIAHHTETQRSVAFIEKTLKGPFASRFGASLYSFATDLRHACRTDPLNGESAYRDSCAGSLYWNWAPTYQAIFDLLKAGTWEPRSTFLTWKAGGDAPLGFEPHKDTASVLTIPLTDIQNYRFEMQNNPDWVWDPNQHGGIKFVGQRDLDRNGAPDLIQEAFFGGEVLNEPNELDRMCWFVQGAWEFPACTTVDGRGCTATLASLVPAMVPYGPKMDPTAKDIAGNTCSTRADKCTSTTDPASTTDRAKYGDVMDFITLSPSISGDPKTAMNCPTN